MPGMSLVVQWLRICLAKKKKKICLAMPGTWVWSLVGELGSHMPQNS